jgi:2,4-dienoyl-CoA reductase-like NADH-dependent reductase (Old Yellow Enzyme family)
VKHCHGYLLHEFLAARDRSGRFGGPSLPERTRLLEAVVAAVGSAAPDLALGVRLSAFDLAPFGGFGVDDADEPLALARTLGALGVTMVNVTGGSPYYVPHAQRPAAFPPSDGSPPPEDPLCGVARLLHAARGVKAAAPELTVVSSGWTYLQEYVPHVAQACVRDGWFDAVGLGRMMLSYPTFAADVLAGRALDRERVCRTFSDCTTAPRHGMVSGCFPLDPFYRDRPERAELLEIKRRVRGDRPGRPAGE